MGITTGYAKDVLSVVWGGDVSKVKVGTYYLGLSISAINKDGTGIREPNNGVGGYARVAIANTNGADGSFAAATNAKVSNAKDFSFAKFTDNPSVTGTTGNLRASHWFFTDDPTSTDPTKIKWYGELKNSRPLEIESIVTFGVGELILEIEIPTT